MKSARFFSLLDFDYRLDGDRNRFYITKLHEHRKSSGLVRLKAEPLPVISMVAVVLENKICRFYITFKFSVTTFSSQFSSFGYHPRPYVDSSLRALSDGPKLETNDLEKA